MQSDRFEAQMCTNVSFPRCELLSSFFQFAFIPIFISQINALRSFPSPIEEKKKAIDNHESDPTDLISFKRSTSQISLYYRLIISPDQKVIFSFRREYRFDIINFA